MSGASLSFIVQLADRLFPFDQAESWDNCGIQIGDPNTIIHSVSFGLDPTPETVQFAAKNSSELLVTHHPLLIEPIKTIRADDFTGRTILEAARAGVAILSLHTNLDAVAGGLNDHLASLLGLRDTMMPESASCARMGLLGEPVPVSELALMVGMKLQIPNVRVIARNTSKVQKVFIASGSGMSYFDQAVRLGADAMVTGDVRYHAARKAIEMGLPVIDAGHFGLEKTAPGLLMSRFQEEFTKQGLNIDCKLCDCEKEPYQALSQP